MKRFFLQLIAVILLATACKQNATTTKSETEKTSAASTANEPNFKDGFRSPNRLFPDKLRDLPNEIIAAHYPNPCYATLEDSMYIWKHNITIQTKEDLQIVEYGSFVYTEKGWYLRVTFSPKDFESAYNCKDGLLKKGVVYTDNASWRRDNSLRGGDAMWYFIAKDKNGKLIKGTAPIETEGKLINSSTKEATVTQSKLTWTGYGEIGGYSLTGNIKIKAASIQLEGDSVKKGTITIDMTSITHDDDNLENHLKDTDFFDVSKFPVATFEVKNIKYTNQNSAIASGELTIKGISKPLSFPMSIIQNEQTKTINAKISIDRTIFGIKYNSKSFFGGLGDKAIKNNFDLAFSITIK